MFMFLESIRACAMVSFFTFTAQFLYVTSLQQPPLISGSVFGYNNNDRTIVLSKEITTYHLVAVFSLKKIRNSATGHSDTTDAFCLIHPEFYTSTLS